MSEILNVLAAVACTALVVSMVRTKIKDDREHRRFMDNLRRTQTRIEREVGKD
jgi:hypothetical protein